MLSKEEIRLILIYKLKLGRTAVEAIRIPINIWRDKATSERTMYRVFEKFCVGGTNFKNEESSEPSSEADYDQ